MGKNNLAIARVVDRRGRELRKGVTSLTERRIMSVRVSRKILGAFETQQQRSSKSPGDRSSPQ
jgi:hypothetical protein